MTQTKLFAYFDSPLGPIYLEGDEAALNSLYFPDHKHWAGPNPRAERDDDAFFAVREQLTEYFAGTRRTFDIPTQLQGTPFQQRVWAELTQIPFGETISYAELARRVGKPSASRAVGAANGRNPISIIVPCHRVIAADGKLTGYGGGLDNKRRLLDWERSVRLGIHASHDHTCTSPAMSAAAK